MIRPAVPFVRSLPQEKMAPEKTRKHGKFQSEDVSPPVPEKKTKAEKIL